MFKKEQNSNCTDLVILGKRVNRGDRGGIDGGDNGGGINGGRGVLRNGRRVGLLEVER